MSIIQQAPVWYTATLAPNQRLVALALADFADDPGRCYPSMQRIADKCGYSRRQTSRIVKELRDLGYVTIVAHSTPRTSPTYQLHADILERSEPMKRRQSDTPPDHQPASDQGRQSVTSEMTDDASGDDATVTSEMSPVSPKPSETHHEPPETPSLAIERITDDVTTEIIPRPRNEGWDALEGVFGYRPEGSEASLWGKIAAKANRETDPGREVITRSSRLIAQWGPGALTPASLDKWWNRFGTPLGSATEAEATKFRDDLDREIRRRRAAELDGTPETTRPVDAVVIEAGDLHPDRDPIELVEDQRATVLAAVADLDEEETP